MYITVVGLPCPEDQILVPTPLPPLLQPPDPRPPSPVPPSGEAPGAGPGPPAEGAPQGQSPPGVLPGPPAGQMAPGVPRDVDMSGLSNDELLLSARVTTPVDPVRSPGAAPPSAPGVAVSAPGPLGPAGPPSGLPSSPAGERAPTPLAHLPPGVQAWLQSQTARDCDAWLQNIAKGGLSQEARYSILVSLATAYAHGGHPSAVPALAPLCQPAEPDPAVLPYLTHLALERVVSPASMWQVACAQNVWPTPLPPLSGIPPGPQALHPPTLVYPTAVVPPPAPVSPPALQAAGLSPPIAPLSGQRPSPAGMPVPLGPGPQVGSGAPAPAPPVGPSPVSSFPVTAPAPSAGPARAGPPRNAALPTLNPFEVLSQAALQAPPTEATAAPPPLPAPPRTPGLAAHSGGDAPRKWGSLAALSARAPTLPTGSQPSSQRPVSPAGCPRPGPLGVAPGPPGGPAQRARPSPSPTPDLPLASRIQTVLGADCGPDWASFLAKLALAPPPDWPPIPAQAGGDSRLATWVADVLQLLPHVAHLQPCLASLGPAPALFKSASRGPSPPGQPSLADLLTTSRARLRHGKRALSASPPSPSSPTSGATGPTARGQRPLRSPPHHSARLRSKNPTLLDQLRPDPVQGGPASQ